MVAYWFWIKMVAYWLNFAFGLFVTFKPYGVAHTGRNVVNKSTPEEKDVTVIPSYYFSKGS